MGFDRRKANVLICAIDVSQDGIDEVVDCSLLVFGFHIDECKLENCSI